MKSARQKKLLELIRDNEIGTQTELTRLLKNAGVDVTQATVSRDLRELDITKAKAEGGRQIYFAGERNASASAADMRFERVLKEGFVSMDNAENILVIRTVSGMAMAVAAALDAFEFSELVGTIAGDDTVMCAIRTKADVKKVMEKIRGMINA